MDAEGRGDSHEQAQGRGLAPPVQGGAQPFRIVEMATVVFDEPAPPDTFRPPPGEPGEPVRRRRWRVQR
jgi:hypothetical protein